MPEVQEAVRVKTRLNTSQIISVVGIFALVATAAAAVVIKQRDPVSVTVKACGSMNATTLDCSVLVKNTGVLPVKDLTVQLKSGTTTSGTAVPGTSFAVRSLGGNDSLLQHLSFRKPKGWTPQTPVFSEATKGATLTATSKAAPLSTLLFTSNFVTTATITDPNQFAISGNTVAFSDNVLTNGGDIFLYDLTTRQRTQVTQDGYSRDVDVDGSNVVFVSTLNSQYTVELYTISNQQTTAISSGAQEKRYPKISGDYIVWQDARSGVSQIYAYNVQTKAETHLQTTSTNQTFPDIDGNSVVWVENGQQVMLSDLASIIVEHPPTLKDWNPAFNDSVRTIVLSPDGKTIYVGGSFTVAGGQARYRFAAFDTATGVLKDWNPAFNDSVRTIVLSPDGKTIYVGGSFTVAGGQTRNRLAAFDTATGALKDWNPDVTGQYDGVMSLTLSPDGITLYAGGWFSSINGQPRRNLAAFDTSAGALKDWGPHTDTGVATLVLSPDGKTIYVGTEDHLISFDTTTGVKNLDLNTGNWVITLVLSPDGKTLYTGGGFTSINGQTRNYLAAFNAADGTLTSWNPSANSYVLTLAISPDGTTLYTGGLFSNHLAAFNAADGTLTSWNPSADSDVETLAISPDGTTLYAGGWFSSINGQPRNHLAAFDIPKQTTQITTGSPIRLMPHVSGDNVTWVQWGGGLTNAGTYVYNIPTATTSALSLAATTTSYGPVIFGNRIVRTVAQESNVLDFVMDDVGNDAVYGTCDDLTNTSLTTNHSITNQAWPVMDGYNLIYLGSNGLYQINTNSAPAITQNADQAGKVGQAMTFAVTATDQDVRTCDGQALPISPHISYAAQNLPTGASMTDHGDNTATFTWTPSAGQEGAYTTPTFTATDDGGLASSETVDITVLGQNHPPVFAPVDAKTVYAGQPLAFAVTATDADGDPLTYSAQQLPTGAQFSNTIVTWTPTANQVGDYTITFTVSDGTDTATTQAVVHVLAQPQGGGDTPVVADPGSQAISEGQLLTVQVSATDALNATLALSASNMPTGAAFKDNGGGNGTFTWTPTYDQAGQYTVTFFASNGTLAGWNTSLITVQNMNRAPILDSIGNKTVTVGGSLMFTLAGRDPDSDLVTYTVKSAPAGSVLSRQTFTWTPTVGQDGTYPVTFSVTDGALIATETITITVQPAPPAEPEPGLGGGSITQDFTAFTAKSSRGYYIASGKVWKSTEEPRAAVVVGAGSGAVPQVKIYTSDGELKKTFYAYDKSFRGGVRVAVCDLDGDGVAEIITAPGPGMKPYIREFNASGQQVLSKQIWTLDGKTTKGVNIACGDVNGDGKAEIIAGSEIGSGQMTLHKAKGSRFVNAFPFGRTFTGGIVVSTIDNLGTGTPNVLAATESQIAQIRVLNQSGKRVGPTILPYAPGTKNGLLISSGDVNGDGSGELLVSQTGGTTSRVRIYSQLGSRLDVNFLAYPTTVSGGARTAVGDVEATGGLQAVMTVPAMNTAADVRFFDETGNPF